MSTNCASTSQSPKIAKLYAGVPLDQIERLNLFRSEHPCQHLVVEGIEWEYIDTGRDGSVIVVLPGALGTAESTWQLIEHFSGADRDKRFRVIAVSYPLNVRTMATLTDGIAGLAVRLGVQRAAVCGGSFGGHVAQVLVRRHRELVQKLIISHAGLPKPERGRRIGRPLYWLPVLPMGLLRGIFKLRLKSLMPRTEHEEFALTLAHVREHICFRWNKRGLLNLCRMGADFDLNYRFRREDLAEWDGEVLLIMADDDPTTPAEVRDAMSQVYPNARVHMFQGTGHAAPILKRREYLSLIAAFVS